MREEILELVTKLVQIPSVSGNTEANLQALKTIQEFLGKKYKPTIFKKNNITSYLWSNAKNLMQPKILLLAHLDVVDADEKLFIPILKNDILTGRGSGDMKGNAAVLAWCFKHILDSNKNANIGLLLTTDEEVGGFDGARYVIELGLKPEVLFIPDGGENFSIITSEKAPHIFVVEAKGRGGHSSRAFELDNPINKIFSFYLEAQKIFDIANLKKPWASTFEITTIETDSHTKNKIPSTAKASFSWRWPLEQIKFEEGRKQILEIAKKNDCSIVLEEGWGEGTLIDKNSKYIKNWKKIIESNLSRKVDFNQAHGASDARHFFNHKKYGTKEIIITSAITGGIHSPNEWVDVASLIILANSLCQFIEETI